MRKPVDITRLKVGDKVIAVSTRHTENTPMVGLDSYNKMKGHAERGTVFSVALISKSDKTIKAFRVDGDEQAWSWNVKDLVYAETVAEVPPTPGRWTTFLAEKYQEAA